MQALRLIAGKTAKARIEQAGLTPDLVRMVIGASGGPKWLILRQLDQLVFGHWLAQSDRHIDLVGSSIGAWRMTCAAHPDAAATFNRFQQVYFEYRYTKGQTISQITQASYDFLHDIFSPGMMQDIVANKKRNLNIVAVKGKGITGSHNKYIELAGLLVAAGANTVSRKSLSWFYDRVVLHSGAAPALSEQWQDYSRVDIALTADNLDHALMASGSIPFVVDPIKISGGAPAGIYRDGGVVDYHFDIPWRVAGGIILYPHFYSHLTPGWFDKRRKSRRAKGAVFDQMLLLSPTDDLISNLPFGRIPDRTDFTKMNDNDRLAFWHTVVGESGRLAEEFACLLEDHGKLMDRLETAPE